MFELRKCCQWQWTEHLASTLNDVQSFLDQVSVKEVNADPEGTTIDLGFLS